jgi:hypothetical protein
LYTDTRIGIISSRVVTITIIVSVYPLGSVGDELIISIGVSISIRVGAT